MLSSLASHGDRFYHDIDSPLYLTMMRSARRGPWLPEEDNTLLQLVRTQGANNWVRIAQQIQHRSPKQCRERYHQNLKPSLKHDPISAQEGEVIEQLVQEMGKRWAEIARRLGNRSDNAVKNWWNGSVNRRRRNPSQTTTGFKQVGNRLQPIPFTLPQETIPTAYSRLPHHLNSNDDFANLPTQHLNTERQQPQHESSVTFPPSTSIASQGRSLSLSTSFAADSRSRFPRVQTSELRPELPPLRSSSFHMPAGSRPKLTMEHPPISPALSDASQRQPPSLISDNQSSYSISPRTITTPHPGIPAPVEIGSSVWAETQHTAQYTNHVTNYNIPYQAKQHPRHITFPDCSAIRPPASSCSEERSKDLRMNVSTLLQ